MSCASPQERPERRIPVGQYPWPRLRLSTYCVGQDHGAISLAATNLQHPVPRLGSPELDQRHPVAQLCRRSVAKVAHYLFELLLHIRPVGLLFVMLSY